jgi:hypothetical protein
MRASDYLRAKYQSDRQIALATQHGLKGAMLSAQGVASDIYSGLERASWYSSCFVPSYSNVCQELKAEEVRSLYSVQSIFRHHDVIQHMLYLYFKMLCDDVEKGNEGNAVQDFVRNISSLTSHITVAGGTRYAFASAMSEALAQSGFLSKVVVERLSIKMPTIVFAVQMFGIQQKAALAARALKALDPQYYWILYQAKLEMLYYFIEPLLAEIIKKVKSKTFTSLSELTEFIQGRYGV